MRELFNDFAQWHQRGLRVAVARVIDVEGSGPREPGAAMAVAENGEVVGSVSGGCVEGAVVRVPSLLGANVLTTVPSVLTIALATNACQMVPPLPIAAYI